jgi:hypothetical protein
MSVALLAPVVSPAVEAGVPAAENTFFAHPIFGRTNIRLRY